MPCNPVAAPTPAAFFKSDPSPRRFAYMLAAFDVLNAIRWSAPWDAHPAISAVVEKRER